MLTKEEVQAVVKLNIEEVYERIMDKIPQIIASTISQISHHTAPETHDRLVNLENKADQNKSEHDLIMEKLDKVLVYHQDNQAILKEIRDKQTFKKVVAAFFKKWWHLLSLILTAIGIGVDHWLKSRG